MRFVSALNLVRAAGCRCGFCRRAFDGTQGGCLRGSWRSPSTSACRLRRRRGGKLLSRPGKIIAAGRHQRWFASGERLLDETGPVPLGLLAQASPAGRRGRAPALLWQKTRPNGGFTGVTTTPVAGELVLRQGRSSRF